MKISIIIPYYNNWSLTAKRLIEFYQLISDPKLEIILVDDASPEDYGGAIGWWQKDVAHHDVKYVKRRNNGGFSAAMNSGVKHATGDVLVFYSNDVILKSNFIPDLLSVIDNTVLVGGELYWWDTGWNVFNDQIVRYLSGWFVACTKDVWRELGQWDIRFAPSDYEDVDLSFNAEVEGIELVEIPNAKSHFSHLGGQSFGYSPEREERTHRNRKIFEEKWKEYL